MKNGKMMRGFMCQSTACMAADPRSVVMPRRLDRLLIDDHDKRLINNARYSRLVQLAPSEHVFQFQVVVMRVSIHCQGCAGKVKKHLSKMEGVTSFSIDVESKRVTVMGHVSPVGVLESISKVKKAEFWPCS
ncbi:hypothetical protein HRI_004963100 [Hibiscus trionum]|uniref:HMA domain-containing protein n=1 Tax=Hibiscus trionum TaxID=183268 RepID=A0A9W7MS49_HIBTR|nr:hypothetical protein HRI_004963100 [Hibiscus trionum]